MNAAGGTWWGSWVDRKTYPTVLRLVEGQPFRVESKHLAGFMVSSALARVDIEHAVGTSYRLAIDPDPTKIDWGLATLAQSLVAESRGSSATDRKARHFPPILKLMQMRVSPVEYRP